MTKFACNFQITRISSNIALCLHPSIPTRRALLCRPDSRPRGPAARSQCRSITTHGQISPVVFAHLHRLLRPKACTRIREIPQIRVRQSLLQKAIVAGRCTFPEQASRRAGMKPLNDELWRGYSTMVVQQPSKLRMPVRSRLPAPSFARCASFGWASAILSKAKDVTP